jgi:hypothetical protein
MPLTPAAPQVPFGQHTMHSPHCCMAAAAGHCWCLTVVAAATSGCVSVTVAGVAAACICGYRLVLRSAPPPSPAWPPEPTSLSVSACWFVLNKFQSSVGCWNRRVSPAGTTDTIWPPSPPACEAASDANVKQHTQSTRKVPTPRHKSVTADGGTGYVRGK